jgi:lycopene cyclase domain-containing protein
VTEVDRFQYLLLMGGCLLITLPLELVLGARVYRQPLRLLRTLWLPALVFVVWDMLAIARDHWSFAARYTTGWDVVFDLPVDEVAFFVVIPICALLTFEVCQRLLGHQGDGAGDPVRTGDAP